MANSTTTIKVAVVPGMVKEVVIEVGQTLATVLELANIDTTGYEIRVNGTTTESLETIAPENGMIMLTKKVKGNGVIRVAVVPGMVKEVAVEDGASVNEVLQYADITATGYEIRMNGTVLEDVGVVADGMIMLTKKVKGNS